jgi:N6-adenosine-specific RNA methylase IME4
VSDERFDELPRGHFGAILADPPWKFVTYSERGHGRSASQHYKVMTFEEIASLPVHDVAAPDAWLLLWVPSPHLPFGLQLIERRKHSQKPDEQYERIERLVDGPYLEMFARQRRPGAAVHGAKGAQP